MSEARGRATSTPTAALLRDESLNESLHRRPLLASKGRRLATQRTSRPLDDMTFFALPLRSSIVGWNLVEMTRVLGYRLVTDGLEQVQH